MAKSSRVRVRRVAIESLRGLFMPIMFLGTWHAMQFHPMNLWILIGYCVVAMGTLFMYAYLAYGKLL